MSSTLPTHANASLIESQYALWSENPCQVSREWQAFFEGFSLGVNQNSPITSPSNNGHPLAAIPSKNVEEPSSDAHYLNFRGKVVSLVFNYRNLGHNQAHINPLDDKRPDYPPLALETFGLTKEDLQKEVSTQFFRKGQKMRLEDMLSTLKETYSGFIGFEFTHIVNTAMRNWITQRIEYRHEEDYRLYYNEEKILRWLMESELFESFLAKKFLGEKRFSLEGGEGVMLILNTLLENARTHGVYEIEMGMAHRGRLNILRNFLGKSLTTLLYEFTPQYMPNLPSGNGDVKYHLGYQSIRNTPHGEVRVSLAANPSHLEAVNAVVEGKARARQRLRTGDIVESKRTVTIEHRKQVLPLLIHGDAAFAGQGSVAEVLNLSELEGYRTGGTIHVIINNQIGFTTSPSDARSSQYATDIAKMINAPILHINGEKPHSLIWAALFALDFRQTFQHDIILDMYCYRRHGHNEADLASFTQPDTARKIAQRKPVGHLYAEELIAEKKLNDKQVDAIKSSILNHLENGYQKMTQSMEKKEFTVFSGSTAITQKPYNHQEVITGITPHMLQTIGNALTHTPPTFNLHPTLKKRFLPRRKKALDSGKGLDWALGESLAWGSLLLEGHPVRLSGQDVRRGTFSHRHAVFYDTETRERYFPLKHLSTDQAKLCIYNSLLSEAAVLGFDYGYSLESPNMLILWEAQFGDFSNGAQVIIDQFIASAESKWQTPSSLVLLLPHGYEGMGPEHSSARLERFLQLSAQDNWQVANLTTPAQYFHILRRQKKRDFLKPLVLMTPKSLLSHPEAISSQEDFLGNTSFQTILDDAIIEKKHAIQRLIFCSGKVYYDLLDYRKTHPNSATTALIRIEQIYPLDKEKLLTIIHSYPSTTTWVWAQEEPQNMGAFSHIRPALEACLSSPLLYAGRPPSSSPAAGSKAKHKAEQKKLLEDAFTS